MDDLLESYVNGNISYVKGRLIDVPFSFSDLFTAYVDYYSPTLQELKLFVLRLTD